MKNPTNTEAQLRANIETIYRVPPTCHREMNEFKAQEAAADLEAYTDVVQEEADAYHSGVPLYGREEMMQ